MPPKPPLRILLVSRALPYHVPGGLERHVEDLAQGLVARGCEVHALAGPLPPEEVQRLAGLGITHHAVPLAAPRRYSLAYLMSVGSRIRRVLAAEQIDVIHAQEFALGWWRPRQGDPPLVLTVHGTITSETPLHPDVYRQLGPAGRIRAWARYGRRLAYGPLWRAAMKAAGRILVDSSFTRGEIARLAPQVLGRVHVVQLGVREIGPTPPTYEQARGQLGWQGMHLLTLGRLEWQKGQDLALEALARLRNLDWHYTIAGEGSYGAAIARMIERLGLGDRVTLLGRVSLEEKVAMLAGADLFLWPERTHPAFGLVGLESLLASTPVFATRRGAIPEVLGPHGGWLVDSIQPGPFAEKLGRLLADPQRLREARDGLRDDALARFRFDRMVDATLAQYIELAEERKRPAGQ